MNFSRIGKYYYLRLSRLRGDPHALALGAAIGVFIGITPTIPLHTLAIFILTIATRSSFLAGLITSWIVSNPFTSIPLYYFSLKIGNFVTPYELSWANIKTILDIVLSDVSFAIRFKSLLTLGCEAIIVMLIGGVLLALPFTIAGYYASYSMFIKIRKKRREKHILH